nr:hypothetical protein [Tanacetum cinerariifolium]
MEVLNGHLHHSLFKMFRLSQDYDSQIIEKYFAEYTGIKVKQFRETLLQHMGNVKKFVAESTCHKRQYDSGMNERQMQSKEGKVYSSKALDASLVVIECSDTSSRSENYITHVVDADIRPANDQVPFVEVQLTAQYNVLVNEQQHTEQSEPIYDTYLLKKVDSNTTRDLTNMSHRGGEIDQDAEQYQINELKAQLQAKNLTINNLKKQIKNMHEKSNKAKVKHDTDVIKIINIELEHKVAKLLKENKALRKHYKNLYDSIKVTRTKTIKQTTSLIFKNNKCKAQLQEKVFTIAELKNELRKLKGNNVDTKFAKPSILRKPVLQPPRNQSVVRQPSAFKFKRPNFSKPRFASQVDVNNVLSKPITPYYLPKVQEYVRARYHHVIAPRSSRNSQEESYGSNDMAHNHYLEEARRKIQERNRNSKSSVKSTGRIIKIAGLRWIPTGKMLTDSTTKVDSEPSKGLKDDITNPYECDQTLYVSVALSCKEKYTHQGLN